jgi:hypothetical protein
MAPRRIESMPCPPPRAPGWLRRPPRAPLAVHPALLWHSAMSIRSRAFPLSLTCFAAALKAALSRATTLLTPAQHPPPGWRVVRRRAAERAGRGDAERARKEGGGGGGGGWWSRLPASGSYSEAREASGFQPVAPVGFQLGSSLAGCLRKGLRQRGFAAAPARAGPSLPPPPPSARSQRLVPRSLTRPLIPEREKRSQRAPAAAAAGVGLLCA